MLESKNFCANYLTKFKIDLNGIGKLLRLVGVMNLIFILCQPFNIQGREPYLGDGVWCV